MRWKTPPLEEALDDMSLGSRAGSPTPNLSTAWGAGGAPHMRRGGPALTLGRHSPLPCALHSNLLLMCFVISQVDFFHLYIYSGAPNQIIQTVFSWQCSCDQQS